LLGQFALEKYTELIRERKYQKVTLGNHTGGNANSFYLPKTVDPDSLFRDSPHLCFSAVHVNKSQKKAEAFFDLGCAVICREHAKDASKSGVFLGGGFDGDLVIGLKSLIQLWTVFR
jgi:hypothetical protein